jgi:two-component system, chemotaxis family, CheB/CheR fusion protein
VIDIQKEQVYSGLRAYLGNFRLSAVPRLIYLLASCGEKQTPMNTSEYAQHADEERDANPGDLIVVGSSAGGIEALSTLVSTLPADFPAPIVLAQHLDPQRPSTLDSILQRRTVLRVEIVTSGSTLQPGVIYVVPSNHHVAIKDNHVEVQGEHNKRPRPSVDMLLSSAAKVYGDRLIAVILTGSGSDGAAGAVDVKNVGGTVIVQNPQTARYPSMPLALPPTVVDFEVNIERIGPLLYDLLNGVNMPPTQEKTENALQGILEQVSRQASIDFRPYKSSTILRRVGRRMTVTHNRTIREYAHYLAIHPEEVGELVKSFLINVTQFFRDPDAFAYIKSEILPKLIAQARERDKVLRFWTAGCASGEEPYSLAMLIADLLGPELHEWSIKIFATDLYESAIEFARRGLYSETMLKEVPAEYQERFFERVDHGYRISKMLRQTVIFGHQDLSRSAPFPRISLVLCRNVLIYFTPELQDYVLHQFAFSLSPNGYLFLGKAETVRPNQSFYELVNKHWKVYRCTSNALPLVHRLSPPHPSKPRLDGGNRNLPARSVGKAPSEQETEPSLVEIGQLRRFNELLLRFLPIGIIVIDRTYRVLTANSVARRLLGLRDISTEQDFLHAVRGIPYAEVRSAIDTVFRERNTIILPEVLLDNAQGGNGRLVSLSLAVMQLEAGMPDLVAINVSDVTEQVQVRRQLEAAQAEQAQLMHELSTANKRLNDVNKDLLDANEELQVANEELMLTHEELQATIEEFETTNEELQATNEELETNNEELQATNEELETTNEELRARTSELQELANMLESERVRLSEIVELAPFSILVLRGPNLIVEAFNPRYAPRVAEQKVLGRPLAEVSQLFWQQEEEITRLAFEVYSQDIVCTTPRIKIHEPRVATEPGDSYFVHTLIPSHDANGKVSGVIVYAIDETVQQARESEEERKWLKLIFDNASMAALGLYNAQTTELIMGSSRYLDILAYVHELDRDTLVGRQWRELAFTASSEQATTFWNEVLTSRKPLRLPEVHLTFPGEEQERVCDYTLTPILDKEKPETVRFILVSAVEVTEHVRARKEVEQLNRLQDEFFSLASHELRTPLTSIKGNAQLLQLYMKRHPGAAGPSTSNEKAPQREDEQHTRLLDGIIFQVNQLSRLIDEMMDMVRIHSAVLELKISESVDFVEVIRRVVEQQALTTKRTITLETSEESIIGATDEGRLEQVVTNLVSNAVKYSPPDKPVTVRIERPQEHEMLVSVRDQGYGISEEEQAHIFDRFYRVHSIESASIEGLGLGLYIAHEIVVQLGGRMWLESHQGRGSTFYFALPIESQRE